MEWLTTVQQVVTLISGLIGVISAGVGAFFAVRAVLKANKDKNAKEIWGIIMSMADAAMREAEKTSLKGADKKTMVIESVKAGCKAAGLNIDAFVDQLGAYIDQTIEFVNQMQNKK